MLGDTLSHYRISREIGSGGMGVVYEAEDTVLGRRVAIKMLKGANTQKARLLREAQAISRITHPNIATIYDYGETDEGLPFIVMELVDGEPLNEYLKRRGNNLFETVGILIKIADALSAAHKIGIIHRDIKPSNIIIGDNKSVKVLDFGLSRQLAGDFDGGDSTDGANVEVTRTQKGVILGTPLYLSPEQTLGEETDARSDVFSIGTLIYECITGVSPFRAESIIEVCAKILRDSPSAPSEINPDVPETLDAVTLKALAKLPENRYQDAGSVAAALREIHDELSKNQNRNAAAVTAKMSHDIDSRKIRTGFTDVFRRRNFPAVVFVLMLLLGLGTFAYWQMTRAVYTPLPEAAIWYENGVRALNDGALFAASKNFGKAVETDKNFSMAKIRLAESLYDLGYIEDAKHTKELADDLYANGKFALSDQEELRFQAINKTLLSQFDAAIEKYKELTEDADEAGKAQAHFDLGRAYERDENLPEAMKSYEKVLTYNSASASANLRLGILHGRNQEFEKSEQFFAAAENLYKTQSNPEGEIEVSYQRGIFLSSKGDSEKAKESVITSLKKAEINDIPYQQIKCLLLMSRILRSSGKPDEAMPFAEKADSLARRNNINNLQTQSVLETGTVFLFQINLDKAESKYEEALRLARQYKLKVWENRTLMQLASLAEQKHEADKALDYINQCQNFFEKGNYKKDMLDLLSIKGRAITFKGKFDEALEIYRDLFKRSDEIGDQFQKARSLKGIGTILAKQDKLSDALEPLYDSYSLYNSINKTFEASYSLLSYTDVLLELGRVKESENMLNQLEGLSQKYKQLVSDKKFLTAKAFLIKGKYEESIKIAEELIKEYDFAQTFQTRIVVASAYNKIGQKQRAKKIIQEVISSENMGDDESNTALAYLTQAEIALANDNNKALESGSKAQDMLNKLGKSSLEWQAWVLIGLAHKKLNNLESTREAFANAEVIYSTLSQKWSAEDFKSYSERTDISYFHQLLQ